MSAVLAVLFFAAPALVAWTLLDRAGLLESGLLRAAMSWFLGAVGAGFAAYVLATACKPFASQVLAKAALAVIVLSAAALVGLRRSVRRSFSRLRRPTWKAAAGAALLLAAAAVFSWSLFAPHLAEKQGAIWRSGVYWDFNGHYPNIQTFAFGDNFPAEEPSFSGAPLVYHFFFDLLMAAPVALGVGLTTSLAAVSAAAFFALLALIVGFTRELAGSTAAGLVAAVLTATSGSLRVLDFVASSGARSLAELWQCFWENPAHPFVFSFLRWTPDHYDGAMFNLFYFVAERHLIFATGLLLTALALLATRRRWSPAACIAAGLGFGSFVFWHAFVTISIGAALGVLVLLGPERRRTALVLAGYGAVVGTSAVAVHAVLARPDWFTPEALAGPVWNARFTALLGVPASLRVAIGYYVYAYGPKLFLFPLGLAVVRRRSRELFVLLLAAILPTFALVNTVQMRPVSVYDNHKWLRPMNVLVDVAVAVCLVSLASRRRPWGPAAAAALLVVSTLSGWIELVPFLRARPIYRYATYPSPLTKLVRESTPPGATFVAREARALHLAGRKVFLAPTSAPLDSAPVFVVEKAAIARREAIESALSAAPTVEALCRLARGNGIDFVELPDPPRDGTALGALPRSALLETTADDGRPLRFAAVARVCGERLE